MGKFKPFEQLTPKQKKVLKFFLTDNGCGAKNARVLLEDNYSWQSIEDLRTLGFSKHELDGILGSLVKECYIAVDDERGSGRGVLYFVNEKFLEDIEDKEKLFKDYEV